MSFSDDMKKTLSSWMKKDGPNGDIVLGTRIRLARNLPNVPYPASASKEQLREVLDSVAGVREKMAELGDFEFLEMAEIDELDRQLMVEKHLISPEHANNIAHRGLVLRNDEDISIMVNEEDHLRIQVLFAGLQLEAAWKLANELDDLIESELGYAFDADRGYLTACPTNVGTGMRASAMLHLPALRRVKQLRQVLGTVSKFGLVVRGLYGEGSDASGNIYQISNQVTLGHTEDEMIEHLQRVTSQILASERQAREYLVQPERKLQTEDRIYRSLGVLSNARIMGTQEALELLSDVRLGIDLELFSYFDKEILKQLMVLTRAAHLQKLMGQNLPTEERDRLRASLIRDKLKSKPEH